MQIETGRDVSYSLMKRLVLALAAASLLFASYDNDIKQWREKRRASLMKEDGWLSLVGLEWLHEGENTVKLASRPARTAKFILDKGKVTLVEGGKRTPLLDDMDPKGPTVIQHGSFRYNVIKRGDRYGIRQKDAQSVARTHFKGLTYFPATAKWRIDAKFEPYNPPHKLSITNVLGMTGDETAPGAIVFTHAGKTYRLEPILEQGETDLFVIFKDQTAGKETYGAARYLYVTPPGKDGKVVLDFNKAYNPPCAFTPFATCPLPPPQNRLPFRVEAGEKKYAGGHG